MLNDVLCTMAGVYGLSLYIDVDSDPESWNCAGNLGILGLGLGVVASFHALRKVVRTGDGALAKLKIVNSSRSKLGKQEDAGSRSQLRVLSVRSTRKFSCKVPTQTEHCATAFAVKCDAKPRAMAEGMFSMVQFFRRRRGGAACTRSLHNLSADGASSSVPWRLGRRRVRHGPIGMVLVSEG